MVIFIHLLIELSGEMHSKPFNLEYLCKEQDESYNKKFEPFFDAVSRSQDTEGAEMLWTYLNLERDGQKVNYTRNPWDGNMNDQEAFR